MNNSEKKFLSSYFPSGIENEELWKAILDNYIFISMPMQDMYCIGQEWFYIDKNRIDNWFIKLL